MYKILICLLVLSSCNAKLQTTQTRSVDSRLESIVQSFETEFSVQVNYSITIEPGLGQNQLGVCRVYGNNRQIILNESFYNANNYNHYYIEFVVYHELAHCSLNLGHNTAVLENGYPASIMNPMIFNVSQYEADRAYYIAQLKEASNK
jgi:hypothetical protein